MEKPTNTQLPNAYANAQITLFFFFFIADIVFWGEQGVIDELELTKKYVHTYYQPKYKATLKHKPDNFYRALDIYKKYVEKMVTLREAIRREYGYDYPRMRNYMLELGLYRLGEGWLLAKAIHKIYGHYLGGDSIGAEMIFYVVLPEHLKVQIDKQYSFTVLRRTLKISKIPMIAEKLNKYSVGQELVGWVYMLDEKATSKGSLLIYIMTRTYKYDFDIEYNLFSFNSKPISNRWVLIKMDSRQIIV